MKAADVMTKNVVTISPEADVSAAIKLLTEHDVSALPVVDSEDHVIGIVSEADLLVVSPEEQKALTALAEEVPGVKGVPDETIGDYA